MQSQGKAWPGAKGRLAGADLGHGRSRPAHPPPALPAEEWEPVMVSYGYPQLPGAAVSMDVDRRGHPLPRVKPHLQPERRRQLPTSVWPTARDCGQELVQSLPACLLIFHPMFSLLLVEPSRWSPTPVSHCYHHVAPVYLSCIICTILPASPSQPLSFSLNMPLTLPT